MIGDRIRSLITYLYSQVRCTEGGVLLGRINGPGKVQQIPLGTGLTFSGGKLVATGGGGGPPSWETVSNKPTTFPPASHSHSANEITGLTPVLAFDSSPIDGDPVGSVEVTGSAAVNGGGYTGHSVAGIYLLTGATVNERPTYSPTGDPYSGNGLEKIISFDLVRGWNLTVYNYGSYITDWDEGQPNPGEDPLSGNPTPVGASLSGHSGGTGTLDAVLAGTPGTPGKPGQIAIVNQVTGFLCVRETPPKWNAL